MAMIKKLTEEQKIEAIVALCQDRSELYAEEEVCCVTRGERDAFSAGFLAALEKQGIVKKEWMQVSKKISKVITVALVSTDEWCNGKLVITWGEKAAYTDGFYAGSDSCWKRDVVKEYAHQELENELNRTVARKR